MDQLPLAKLLPLGDAAWTVEFGETIDPQLHARVQGLGLALEGARGGADQAFAAIVDVVPTFRSLTVHYDPQAGDGEALGAALLRLAAEAGTANAKGRRWRIPVCFDADLAPDLDDLAVAKSMRRDEVIALMCATEFRVYMIGFMPGFPYMGGLPKALEMPRLSTPRQAVPARSLAIAGTMCAVYPWESPGGWRLLGRTPIPLFSAKEAEPSLLASGGVVRWRPVGREEYQRLEADAESGRLARGALLDEQGEA